MSAKRRKVMEHVRTFDYQGAVYRDFQVFLEHTDQKTNTFAWLQKVVSMVVTLVAAGTCSAGIAIARSPHQINRDEESVLQPQHHQSVPRG